ncbi:MAG: hypothetical protein ACHQQR_02785 [Gemmatimonadales bacterium]|jgi:hypothetical protein
MTDELDPERLRRLLDSVAALPRSIEPERDAWPAIRNRIEAQRVRAIAPHATGTTIARPRRIPWIAAASVVLVALSSGVTMLVLRQRPAPEVAAVEQPVAQPTAVEPGSTIPPAAATPQVPVPAPPRASQAARTSVGEVFARYDAAAEDLSRVLAERRARLDPATVAVLDTCLTRIDRAIAEARAALGRDPRNAVVTELLTASYRQKLDLLKRVADLPLRGT